MKDDFGKNIFKKSGSEITVRIHPNATKTKFRERMEDGSLKIDIAAPPEKGKANRELIRFLSKECNVSKSNIEILCGETSRVKIVKIA